MKFQEHSCLPQKIRRNLRPLEMRDSRCRGETNDRHLVARPSSAGAEIRRSGFDWSNSIEFIDGSTEVEDWPRCRLLQTSVAGQPFCGFHINSLFRPRETFLFLPTFESLVDRRSHDRYAYRHPGRAFSIFTPGVPLFFVFRVISSF